SQITYTVTSAPTNGTLFANGFAVAAGGTFKQADIDGGKVLYTPAAGAATSDSFVFTVSDGAGGSIGATTFNIALTPLSVGFSGGTYTQEFNSLPSTGTFALSGKGPFGLDTSPVGAASAGGWFMGEIAGTGANANFDVGDGTANNNRLISYGNTGSS